MTGIRLHRRATSRAELRPGRTGAPRVQQHPLHPATAVAARTRTAAQAARLRRTSAVMGAGGLMAGVVALLPGSSAAPLAMAALRTPDVIAAPATPVVITEPRLPALPSGQFGVAIPPTARTLPISRTTRSTAAARRAAPRTAAVPLTPVAYAAQLGRARGWGDAQQGCLVALWERESRWTPSASNPSSGAYGIPQALPGGQMAAAGADWTNNPLTQVRWGIGYIAARYGNPCEADQHSLDRGWY